MRPVDVAPLADRECGRYDRRARMRLRGAVRIVRLSACARVPFTSAHPEGRVSRRCRRRWPSHERLARAQNAARPARARAPSPTPSRQPCRGCDSWRADGVGRQSALGRCRHVPSTSAMTGPTPCALARVGGDNAAPSASAPWLTSAAETNRASRRRSSLRRLFAAAPQSSMIPTRAEPAAAP